MRRLGARGGIALAVGVVVVLGAEPAWALWSHAQRVPDSGFALGALQVGATTSGTLAIDSLLPGQSVAEVVTATDSGSVPLSYWATGVGTAADGLLYSLTLAVTDATTVTGDAPGATCGGTALAGSSTSLTTAAQPIAYTAAERRVVAVGATDGFCVHLTLASDAPDALQGASTTVTITLHAEQVAQP